jgi:hypothetical protein
MTKTSFEGMENNSDNQDANNKKVLNKVLKDKNDTDPMLPGTEDADTTEDFEVGRPKNGGSKIDYASTIEDAYDDLNKILGSDGIKRLTNDTQGLMKQQMQLAKSMESMTPLVQGMMPMIQQMKGMMKSMDGDKEGLDGIMKMAKKLSNNTGSQQ